MPSAVKTNIAANFIGRIWASLMTLLFVPLYIQFLGVEAYGLVGFYASLKAVSSIFDFGLSTTLNREVARYTGSLEGQGFVSDTIRTLEVVYWLTA
ncbi:MAG: oligosaccharide flippase family protein, partial [Deltaproteobacteria bacterium]|nr:oligosaccharide flippase family protein [Deltaproteobacteria bacterium]